MCPPYTEHPLTSLWNSTPLSMISLLFMVSLMIFPQASWDHSGILYVSLTLPRRVAQVSILSVFLDDLPQFPNNLNSHLQVKIPKSSFRVLTSISNHGRIPNEYFHTYILWLPEFQPVLIVLLFILSSSTIDTITQTFESTFVIITCESLFPLRSI